MKTTTNAAVGDKVSGNYFGHDFTGQVSGRSDEWLEIELDAPIDGNCSIAMHRTHDASKFVVVERFAGQVEASGGGLRIVRTVEELRARFAKLRAWSKLSVAEFEARCVAVTGERPACPRVWVLRANSVCEKAMR